MKTYWKRVYLKFFIGSDDKIPLGLILFIGTIMLIVANFAHDDEGLTADGSNYFYAIVLTCIGFILCSYSLWNTFKLK